MAKGDRAPETSLYDAVKQHLEGLGYAAKGEIHGCDIVAIRPGEPPFVVITELKLGFTLELLLQAVDRLAMADEVWLAVPQTRRGRDQDRRAWKLCRMLGFGLLAVNPARGSVQVLTEPAPYRPRVNAKRQARVLTEHRNRRGDPATGGSTRQPIMTAYRQRALDCAALLRAGPLPTRALRATVPDAATILLRNVYGWFEREARGVYGLTALGEAAALLAQAAAPAVAAGVSASQPAAGMS
jgi:hypothetical protein